MAMRVCGIEGCSLVVYGRGWCNKHYQRWYKNGDPENLVGRRQHLPLPGFYISKNGYKILTGQWQHPLALDGEVSEHRQLLYDLVGPGPHPCHWCGRLLEWPDIKCDHLDGDLLNNDPKNLVVSSNNCNLRRGKAGNPLSWNPDTCLKGHEFTTENTYIYRGKRNCRICRRDFMRKKRIHHGR
jgi:hypothetical protein